LNEESRFSNIYTINKYVHPTTTNKTIDKTDSYSNITLEWLNYSSNNNELTTIKETSNEYESSPFKNKLKSANVLINPLSRDQSNKILFHDVFLIDEKEKLFNQ